MTLIIGTPYNTTGTASTLSIVDDYLLPPGVLVFSTDSTAVDSANGGHDFVVYGTIIGLTGIQMGDDDTDIGNTLVIAATGCVSTFTNGDEAVDVQGGQAKVTNFGLISGTRGVIFDSTAGTGSAITNFGTIITSSTAVGTDGAEKITLVNQGTIISYSNYSFVGGTGKDVVINKGTMTGPIGLWTNDDTYNCTGGRVNGIVYGENGNDTLIGGSFADRLNGGPSNDLIWGRGGKDILTGGTGLDKFYFDTAPNTATNRDQIVGFSAVDDTIYLKKSVFAAIAQGAGVLQGQFYWEAANGLAHDATDRIILNTTNGVVSYDSNGNAAGGVQQIALLSGVGMTPSNLDFFVY